MVTFDLMLRNQKEALEIILYKNDKNDKYKISKEIKRIRYNINLNEMGEKNIEGVKFTLILNEQNINFPKHPPFIREKRYIHLYYDRYIFSSDVKFGELSNSFFEISINDKKLNRFSDCTRVYI